MKKFKLALALLISLIAAGASAQPYTSRYFHYDQYYDADPDPFDIQATTVDGNDVRSIRIVGGGAATSSRGGYIHITGNENPTSGSVNINGGDTGTSAIRNYTAGALRLTIPYLADSDNVDLVLGSTTTTAPVFKIRGNTADADDDGVLHISPGGDAGVVTRGSYITLSGNEVDNGNVYIASGWKDAGYIKFLTAGFNRFYIHGDPYDNKTGYLIYGAGGINDFTGTIKALTLDGADQSILQLTGGGQVAGAALSATRGAYMQLQGADVGGANFGGSINIVGGIGASSTNYPLINVYNDTVDGSDWGQILLTSGATTSSIRGAALRLAGNESSSTGSVVLSAGNVAGGVIRFGANGGDQWTIPYTGAAQWADLVFSLVGVPTARGTIRSDLADGLDTANLRLTAGGAYSSTGTRGSVIDMWGNEHVSGYGNLDLRGGDTGNGGHIRFFVGAGEQVWAVTRAGAGASTVADFVYGIDTSTTIATIRSARADAADVALLQLTGGGSSTVAGSRGAYIQLEGEDRAGLDSGGNINIVSGVGASAADYPVITIRSDTVDGSDWGQTNILGGGGTYVTTGARGSQITVSGNEAGLYGNVDLRGGDNGNGGHIRMFTANNALMWSVLRGPGGSPSVHDLVYGTSGSTSSVATIRSQLTDGIDSAVLQLTGGGSSTLSGARGAYVYLEGSDVGGLNKGGDISIIAGIGASANAGEYPVIDIRTDTVDGSDWGRTYVGGGGGIANAARGSYLNVNGNESGGGGAALLTAGSAGGDPTVYISAPAGSHYLTALGNFQYYPGYPSNNGAGVYLATTYACEELTIAAGSGSAGVNTANNLCATGIIIGVGARITQAPGGGATTFDVGCTGSGNLDQFCDGISTALNTTCAYPLNGDGTNTPWVQKTGTTLTVTTDADVTGASMKIRLCPYRFNSIAPTS